MDLVVLFFGAVFGTVVLFVYGFMLHRIMHEPTGIASDWTVPGPSDRALKVAQANHDLQQEKNQLARKLTAPPVVRIGGEESPAERKYQPDQE